jgi:hypothetical protein
MLHWHFFSIMDTDKLVTEAIEESLKIFIESQENFETRNGYKKVSVTKYLPTSIYIDTISQINEAPILSGGNLLFDSSGEFLVSLLENNSTETKLCGFEFHLYGTFARFSREYGKIIILELGKLNYKERRSG